jgi:hypothetical protein
MNLSLLIHTFNGYKHLWRGCTDKLEYAIPPFVPVYLGTDIQTDFSGNFHVLYSGKGEWSDRLQALLNQIGTDYLLYLQEDHWATRYPPDLSEMMKIMTGNDLFRLQISPIVPFYTLKKAGEIHFFEPNSKYLVSHQPSIWKKSFLLECLKSGETPWKNEYEGTKRLQITSQMRDYIRGKIAIYPSDWYRHMCIKGKVVSES